MSIYYLFLRCRETCKWFCLHRSHFQFHLHQVHRRRHKYLLPFTLVKFPLLLWNSDTFSLILIEDLLNFLEWSVEGLHPLSLHHHHCADAFRARSFFFYFFSSLLWSIITWVMRGSINWSSFSLVRSFASRIAITFGSQLWKQSENLVDQDIQDVLAKSFEATFNLSEMSKHSRNSFTTIHFKQFIFLY